MAERSLQFFDWEFERVDMLKLLDFAVATNPVLNGTQVAVKAYQIVEHGALPEELVEFIDVKNLQTAFEQVRLRVFREKNWPSWQTGIGGVFFRNRKPEHFIPMIDIEVTSTDNPANDAQRLEGHLKELDIDGSLVRSGDPGIGGYFFVGYNPLPYVPAYWRFMGKVLVSFAEGDASNAISAKELGNRLLSTTSIEKSVVIADEILKRFPSIRNGNERRGVLCDPRWIGHKLKEGFTILRQTPGKSYGDKPLQVAGYY